MNLRVAGVVELLQDNCTGSSVTQLLGLGNCALHAVCARSENDLGSVCGGQLAALDTHGLGHGQDNLVTLDCTN